MQPPYQRVLRAGALCLTLTFLTGNSCAMLGLNFGKRGTARKKERAAPTSGRAGTIAITRLSIRPGNGFKGLRFDYRNAASASAKIQLDVAAFDSAGNAVTAPDGKSGRWLITASRRLGPNERDTVTWERLWKDEASCLVVAGLRMQFFGKLANKRDRFLIVRDQHTINELVKGIPNLCMGRFFVARALDRRVYGRGQRAVVRRSTPTAHATQQSIRLGRYTVLRCSLGRRLHKGRCRGFARREMLRDSLTACAKIKPRGRWRVPTVAELQAIGRLGPASGFRERGLHWSTSNYKHTAAAAAAVRLPDGRVDYLAKFKGARVICLRR